MLRTFLSAVIAAVIGAALAMPPALAQGSKTDGAEKRKATPAVTAMRERQKKCGAEWKAAKAAGRAEKGMKWPQYWSACNKRLKAAGA